MNFISGIKYLIFNFISIPYTMNQQGADQHRGAREDNQTQETVVCAIRDGPLDWKAC